jgi:hypothetical protein
MRISSGLILALLPLLFNSCATPPQIQVGQKSGSKIGLFWFSGLNGDQAADSVAQKLLTAGYNLADMAATNRAIVETKFNAQQISTDSLLKLRSETGIDFLLVGSSSPLPGILNFSHAKMALTLIDIKKGVVVWNSTYGNPIFTGAIGTKGDVERGASILINAFDSECSKLVKVPN